MSVARQLYFVLVWCLSIMGLSACVPLVDSPQPQEQLKAMQLIEQGVLHLRRGDLSQARASFEVASQLCPSPQALDGLGAVAFLQGDSTLAAKFYEAAIELDPQYSEAYANLALLQESEGHPEQALRSYQRSIELSTLNFRARNNLAAMIRDSSGDALVVEHELLRARAIAGTPLVEENLHRIGAHYENSTQD